MRNILIIMREDVKRLFTNVVSVIITLGLVLTPSLFTWYNTLACWNVFDNTGNLKVAVASLDEGYKGDYLPVTVNIGDQVINGLRGNSQIGWVFTTADDAIEGARSGEYYAAVVLPETFTKDLLLYCFGGEDQASIIYYSNQKLSAIAPKVTDQGADAVSAEINKVLAEAVSTVLLSAIDSLWDYAQEQNVDQAVMDLPNDFRSAASRLQFLASTLNLYSNVACNAGSLAKTASSMAYELQGQMSTIATSVQNLRESTQKSMDDLEQAVQQVINELNSALDEYVADDPAAQAELNRARTELNAANTLFRDALQPEIDELEELLKALQDSADQDAASYIAACGSLGAELSSLSSQLSETSSTLANTASKISATSAKFTDAAEQLEVALTSEDMDTVRKILSSDVETLSSALSSPVGVERVAIYPVDSFGSAMSPLYTTLALFIGALLIMVTLKPVVCDDVLRLLNKPRRYQQFLGHFGVVFVLATLQSVLMALGNMYFLQIEVVNPWLYLLVIWASGMTYAFIAYAMVALFANLGKAMLVLLLIMQVTGCEGSFPLELLPGFVSEVSPYLPATYSVAAIRAAMLGVYAGDVWFNLAMLTLFCFPLLFMGVVLAGPMHQIVKWYINQVDQSHLMN